MQLASMNRVRILYVKQSKYFENEGNYQGVADADIERLLDKLL